MTQYIGHQAPEGNNAGIQDGYVYAQRFLCTHPMLLDMLYLYQQSDTGDDYKMAVYSDDAGVCDALLAQTAELQGLGSSGWGSGAISPPLKLSIGVWYWLAIFTDGGWNNSPYSYYRYAGAGAAPSGYFNWDTGHTYPTFPNPFTPDLPPTATTEIAIYGTGDGIERPLPGFIHG